MISILQELDTLGKQSKALRLLSKKGNWPLPWTKNIKIVYDSTKTTSLPKNWYHCKWYESLCPFEQGDLNCADPENLPSIVSHPNFSEVLLSSSSQSIFSMISVPQSNICQLVCPVPYHLACLISFLSQEVICNSFSSLEG